jgi:hypothetical protein
MPTEAAQGGQPAVPSGCLIVTALFQVIQEPHDLVHRDVSQAEPVDTTPGIGSQERKKQPQGIAISSHRMRTGPTHLLQVLDEKRFHQRE